MQNLKYSQPFAATTTLQTITAFDLDGLLPYLPIDYDEVSPLPLPSSLCLVLLQGAQGMAALSPFAQILAQKAGRQQETAPGCE